MDEALAFLERSTYGNQASLFTSSGAAARRFRYEAPAGNIGINIGVAAPMAYFPFSGWKDSFFGICMARAATRSSSIPRRKSWSSAGPKNTRASSEWLPSSLKALTTEGTKVRKGKSGRHVRHDPKIQRLRNDRLYEVGCAHRHRPRQRSHGHRRQRPRVSRLLRGHLRGQCGAQQSRK